MRWLVPSLLLALSCDRCSSHDEEQVETVSLAPAEPPQVASPALVSASRELMGTVFQIQAEGDDAVVRPVMNRAFDEIARIESLMSEWQETSEISRINAAAGQGAVVVSPETLSVIQAGLDISERSQGAFDLTWAALHGLYDFRREHIRIPPLAEVRERLTLIDYRQVSVDPATRAVRLGREGMKLGTGGIAKGYALDEAGEILEAAGIHTFMLFGGGQVQTHGRRHVESGERAWKTGIQHPRQGDYFAFIETENHSISTSGDYEHDYVDADGVHWHHIIDPETGLPARQSLSVTLVAPDGMHADALSTAVFILGAERGLAMLRTLPFEVYAVVIDAECKVHVSEGFEGRVHFTMELGEDRVLPGCRETP